MNTDAGPATPSSKMSVNEIESGTRIFGRSKWAKKRVEKSVAYVHPTGRSDVVADQMMQEYLQREGFLEKIVEPDGS